MSTPPPAAIELRVAVIGDAMVGKTSLIWSYTRKELPTVYLPTTYDIQSSSTMYKGHAYSLSITDTSGVAKEQMLSLALTGAQVVMICFSTIDRKSFKSVQQQWIKDARFYCPDSPIVVVGLKKDLRKSADKGVGVVSKSEAKDIETEAGVYSYVECCASNENTVNEAFETAIRAVVEPDRASSMVKRSSVFYV